ncbi:DUF4386 domain-containing protein [Niabella sp. CC-SYL272]|uniref:DUF4386 domain-containing protein n=1 Tax=Niabella agricola TaxID=2891571 RepID=UPI001F4222AA|nr:DUF4386 domain-containing protein [Niabella agricola]MCF3107618.1 DUF4386 domain-containing protein [Niabella agricola]
MTSNSNIKMAGSFYLLSIVTGLLSVAPSVDGADYLVQAAANEYQVIIAAVFQFIISFAYLGVAVLLYPIIKKYNNHLAVGFLSCRIIAVTLCLIATVLLLAFIALSKDCEQYPSQASGAFRAIGTILKTLRDLINHVFMIGVLCIGNVLFFFLLIKAKMIPEWLSCWGIVANILSIGASALVLFKVVDIITPVYLVLNAPTVLLDLILGLWLIVKGLNHEHCNGK